MDQIGQEIMARVIWLLVVLSPFMLLDFALNRGRLTRRLFGYFGEAINALIGLFFRLIGTGLRALGQGIWRGIRGQRRNQGQQTRRVEHHHFYHGCPGDEAGGEDNDQDD